MHLSATDWFTALGAAAAWTVIIFSSVGFILRWAIRGAFNIALEPIRQEIGTLSAAVNRLDVTIKELREYTHHQMHEVWDRKADVSVITAILKRVDDVLPRVVRMEESVSALTGNSREMFATLNHVKDTLDRIGGGRAGRQ